MFAKISKQKITEPLSIAAYHSFFYFRVILCSVHCHFLCRNHLVFFAVGKLFVMEMTMLMLVLDVVCVIFRLLVCLLVSVRVVMVC